MVTLCFIVTLRNCPIQSLEAVAEFCPDRIQFSKHDGNKIQDINVEHENFIFLFVVILKNQIHYRALRRCGLPGKLEAWLNSRTVYSSSTEDLLNGQQQNIIKERQTLGPLF